MDPYNDALHINISEKFYADLFMTFVTFKVTLLV